MATMSLTCRQELEIVEKDTKNFIFDQDTNKCVHINDGIGSPHRKSSNTIAIDDESDFNLWSIKLHHTHVFKFRRLFYELMNSTERKLLYFAGFCVLCGGALRLTFFMFIAGIIDLLADTYHSNLHHICNIHQFIHCESNNQSILAFAVTLIVVSIFSALFEYARSTLSSMAIHSFLQRLNTVLFDKLMNQNLSFFESKSKHHLKRLFTKDMKIIRLSLHRIVFVLEASIHFLCGITYLFIINWDIALIIVCSFVLLSVLSIIFITKSEAVHKLRRKAFEHVISGVRETLNYITTIKTFGKEDDESYIYSQCIDRAFASAGEANALLYAYQLWISMVIYGTILSIVWYSSSITIEIGALLIDLFIWLQLNCYIYQMVRFAPSVVVKGSQSLIRMLQVIDVDTEQQEDAYIPPSCSIEGTIQIRNINFAYPQRKNRLVLNNICMDFYPSTTTALVGLNASGKSTVFKLLMRFFDATSGQILIDGVDYTKYNVAFLHSQIGYVGHDVALFYNRSIADNIKYGIKLDKKSDFLFDSEHFNEEKMFFWRQSKSITQAEVEEVAKIANAHEFIMNLSDGYDTIIGDGSGTRLSHGEKQRIGIARALLLDPKILLLDEAMSGVDAISKQLIQESLSRIMVGRCVIIVAHSLKTLQNTNRIYVIKNGKNMGCGTHEELIQNNNQHYMNIICNDRHV
eukprot:41887_1